jgi:LmbE family N-acetylglucosaminyl deacetylase
MAPRCAILRIEAFKPIPGMTRVMHVLCIGAHPDDNEYYIGGTAALMAQRGDTVRFVSVTDGSKGHFTPEYIADPDALARRRYGEAIAATRVIGAEYEMLGIPDGEVYVTHATTEMMVRTIRSFGPQGHGPDLVLMNRPTDYHRDHRYTAQLILDAAYVLTVPAMCPDCPALRKMPVFAYWYDQFTEGGTFRTDIAVSVDGVIERKIEMISQHASQFYEWIPYNEGTHTGFADFPTDHAARRERLATFVRENAASVRAACAERLPADVAYSEAFQISEYGRRLTPDEVAEVFP